MKNIAMLIIGILFFCLGVYVIVSYIKKLNRLRRDGSEKIVPITKIIGMRDNRKALIESEAMGEKVEVELGYYSTGMRAGDKVKICVSNNNPQDFIYVGSDPIVLGVFTSILGICLIIISLCLLI